MTLRLTRPGLALLLGLTAVAGAQEQTGRHPDERLPPSGLGATTMGQRVILYGDGSWKVDEYAHAEQIKAMSDHGRNVLLSKIEDPSGEGHRLVWEYADPSGGPVQVVISRAITTDRSAHSNNDNCIPVVTVRNLTELTLFRIVAELEFRTDAGAISSTSVMLGPLDSGEEDEKVASPLLVDDCRGLTARLHVAYCSFAGGLDCTHTVAASEYGTIPLEMATER